MNEEELKQRIGWLCAECGSEDFEIQRLEDEIERRKTRRDALWKETTRLSKELAKKRGF